jgi:hypothetical protein
MSFDTEGVRACHLHPEPDNANGDMYYVRGEAFDKTSKERHNIALYVIVDEDKNPDIYKAVRAIAKYLPGNQYWAGRETELRYCDWWATFHHLAPDEFVVDMRQDTIKVGCHDSCSPEPLWK